MRAVRFAAIVLVVSGLLGLFYGGLDYTKDTFAANSGAIELSVMDKKTINVPLRTSVGAIVIGGVLLLLQGGRNR